jgi:hypothetical protein
MGLSREGLTAKRLQYQVLLDTWNLEGSALVSDDVLWSRTYPDVQDWGMERRKTQTHQNTLKVFSGGSGTEEAS